MLQCKKSIRAPAPLHSTFMNRTNSQARRPRIVLALAGGGPLGAIHEISVLSALDNPKAHLCAPPRAPTAIGRAIASLEGVMDELGHPASHAAHAR
jgi:hypothetical protein